MSYVSDHLVRQAFQARRENRPDDAKRKLVEAVGPCREAGAPVDLAKALTGLGQIERDMHRGDAARQHYEEAVAIYREEGDSLRLAHAVRHLGDIHRKEGRMEIAEPCYHEVLQLHRSDQRTAPLDLANAVGGLAILKSEIGEAEQARLHWAEARDLYASVDVKEGVPESSRRLALRARTPRKQKEIERRARPRAAAHCHSNFADDNLLVRFRTAFHPMEHPLKMQSSYNGLPLPQGGEAIEYVAGKYRVPDHPIIPFIEGDGTGRDIWRASQRVFDAAVEKAYGGKRAVKWFEIFAGEKAYRQFKNWLPDDSVNAARDLRVSIKGPLTTPVGGGIRSLNVALRQTLDLYACVRPVKYYAGVPSPVKHPEKLNVVIYRENTEDIYAGIEFREGTAEAKKFIDFVNDDMLKGSKKRIRQDSGVGVKPISITGSKRLVRFAIKGAIEQGRKTVTLVHKGNIQKFTEGAFREWGYEVATQEFRDDVVTERESWILGNLEANKSLTVEQNALLIEPGLEFASDDFRKDVYAEVKHVVASIGGSHGNGKWKQKILVNDRIADSIFQQVIIRPEDYSVLATTNLNGDYISDACAAQVGGLGIAPGANIGDGYAVFEATHGTAPKYADKDVINPGSVMLSGVMLFDFLGWSEAARLIETSMERTIQDKKVTYDFERQMPGATKVKTSEFATEMIGRMK